eukprot:TRINITY_DN4183_c0_g3_i2.p1 TRINITY_DN4183_c0_g3~~TRINITY_DN4183_c0_g3_i2.p1  ORF type:complete len:638 (-),score=125.70 TRINITY_DN4183_c0_g3_i2:53-1771(-)
MQFSAYGKLFDFRLEKNMNLLSADYKEIRVLDDGQTLENDVGDVFDHCHYLGYLINDPASKVALSTCDGVVGVVKAFGSSYHIGKNQDGDHIMYKPSDVKRTGERTCKSKPMPVEDVLKEEVHGNYERAEPLVKEISKRRIDDKMVELVIVNDHFRYNDLGDDTEAETIKVANLVNYYYLRTDFDFRMIIVLVGQVTFTSASNNPLTYEAYGASEISSDALLDSLDNWARLPSNTVIPDRFDTSSLISHTDFDDSTIGLAVTTGVCTHNSIVQYDPQEPILQSASTMTHEIGHSLSLGHDGTSNSCSDDEYVMAAYAAPEPQTFFSSCSIEELNSYMHVKIQDPSYCLNDVPSLSPSCGDGVVSDGEDCDCGHDNCTEVDPCCDGSTCKLVADAECSAFQRCCDADTCSIKSEGTVCREAFGDCDYQDTCDGIVADCFNDIKDDGVTCPDSGSCYQGYCVSFASQCSIFDDFYAGGPFLPCEDTDVEECGRILCRGNNGNANICNYFNDADSNEIQFADGTPCETGKICVNATCTIVVDSVDTVDSDNDSDEADSCKFVFASLIVMAISTIF